jgi:hypothetical protein
MKNKKKVKGGFDIGVIGNPLSAMGEGFSKIGQDINIVRRKSGEFLQGQINTLQQDPEIIRQQQIMDKCDQIGNISFDDLCSRDVPDIQFFLYFCQPNYNKKIPLSSVTNLSVITELIKFGYKLDNNELQLVYTSIIEGIKNTVFQYFRENILSVKNKVIKYIERVIEEIQSGITRLTETQLRNQTVRLQVNDRKNKLEILKQLKNKAELRNNDEFKNIEKYIYKFLVEYFNSLFKIRRNSNNYLFITLHNSKGIFEKLKDMSTFTKLQNKDIKRPTNRESFDHYSALKDICIQWYVYTTESISKDPRFTSLIINASDIIRKYQNLKMVQNYSEATYRELGNKLLEQLRLSQLSPEQLQFEILTKFFGDKFKKYAKSFGAELKRGVQSLSSHNFGANAKRLMNHSMGIFNQSKRNVSIASKIVVHDVKQFEENVNKLKNKYQCAYQKNEKLASQYIELVAKIAEKLGNNDSREAFMEAMMTNFVNTVVESGNKKFNELFGPFFEVMIAVV